MPVPLFHGSYLLAVLGFSAAAWKVAPRDRFIGWDDGQRRRNLHRIVNNSRFEWHCRGSWGLRKCFRGSLGALSDCSIHPTNPINPVAGRKTAAVPFAPRDRFIGWDDGQRRRNLHRIVNNSRFLIFPWVEVRNLASCILATAAKRLGDDWKERYGYEPVLLETFVDRDRFRGTCYRAANWIHVGDTQGRGKLDRRHRGLSTVKHIYLYPLHKRFRQKLCPTPDE